MKHLSHFAIYPYMPIVFGILLGATLGYFGQCSSGTCPLTSTWWRGAIYGGVLGTLFFFTSGKAPDLKHAPGSATQERVTPGT
ncbi:MAG: DUF6132 family protein [Verrucomicrobiota bacterium]|nr:hypothetical protein [Chthoniobacterales bacterium]MDQ3314804.1 DUF6132 family protein [Verrucomicrobiota bacterium]